MSDSRSGGPVDYGALSVAEQEQILVLQQAILAAVTAGEPHRDIVDQLCRLEEQLVPNSVGSVMLLDGTRTHLDVYAAPSIPPEGIARLRGLRPGPGAGSCGNVIYRGEAQFVSNTFTDPRWVDLRQLAVDFNLCACWSVPIRTASGEITGKFALSSFEQRAPTSFHRKLLEIGAHIIGIVLERAAREKKLQLSAKVFESSSEAILIADADNRIVSVNRAFTEITGFPPDEVIGKNPRILSSGRHDARFYRILWDSVKERGHWQGEIWNKRKNGEVYAEFLSISAVRDADGRTTDYVGIFSDVTTRKLAEQRIEFFATHDPLTELPNRLLALDRFGNARAAAQRNGKGVAMVYVDLDNFKLVNDSAGHAVGDALLRAISERLTAAVRESDTVCRLGGDEFVLILPDVREPSEIAATATRLLEELRAPFGLEDSELVSTCSMGIAVYPDDGDDFDALLHRADMAMYHAKNAGRDTYRFFTQQMNVDASAHLQMRSALRGALERNELFLHYQPQVELATGRVNGVEALLRWRSGTLGHVPPSAFIPQAETSGLINPIGEWVLEEACRQAVAWSAAGVPPITVAVNLSALQFRRGNLEETVLGALERSGLDPSLLELEITESTLMTDTDSVLTLIRRLQAMGVRFSIDDFGTGYSSLAYLQRFRVDKLKIDQSFVRGIEHDRDNVSIVRAIVQLAGNLGMTTIAEGVESAAALAVLRDCGCTEAQGYFHARPLPARELPRFVADRLRGSHELHDRCGE